MTVRAIVRRGVTEPLIQVLSLEAPLGRGGGGGINGMHECNVAPSHECDTLSPYGPALAHMPGTKGTEGGTGCDAGEMLEKKERGGTEAIWQVLRVR